MADSAPSQVFSPSTGAVAEELVGADSQGAAPPDPQSCLVQAMAAEVEALQRQLAEHRDHLLRAMAETDNVRKRSQREIEETSKYAITGFARELVDVFENLYRASATITDAPPTRTAATRSPARSHARCMRLGRPISTP